MKRQPLLLGALALSLLAAWWAAGLDDADAPPPPRGAGKALRREPAGLRPDLAALARPARTQGDDTGTELFPVRSFQPPPPPPPPPAPPTAPPLPFRHGGMYEDGGPPAALLAEGERLHIVRVGDVLDGRYRVSAVGRARVDLVYLPLNQTQSLASGAIP